MEPPGKDTLTDKGCCDCCGLGSLLSLLCLQLMAQLGVIIIGKPGGPIIGRLACCACRQHSSRGASLHSAQHQGFCNRPVLGVLMGMSCHSVRLSLTAVSPTVPRQVLEQMWARPVLLYLA